MNKINRRLGGQSLLEVIFALVVIALVASAIVGLSTVSVRNSIHSRNNTQAKGYAQETIEWLRKKRDVGPWKKFVGFAGSIDDPKSYCLTALDNDFTPEWTISGLTACSDDDFITGTSFTRVLRLAKAGDSEKVQASVVVVWVDAQGSHQSTIVTEFTKW